MKRRGLSGLIRLGALGTRRGGAEGNPGFQTGVRLDAATEAVIGSEAGGLLPESAAEIARIYDEITGMREPMTAVDAQEIQTSTPVLAGWVADVVLLLVGMGLFSTFAPILTVALLCAVPSYLILSYRESRQRVAEGEAMPGATLWAISPFSHLTIQRGVARWREIHRRDPNRPVDVTSLEVLEPVARYLAAPILMRARLLAASAGGNDERAAARAEARRDELLAQASRETDPVWARAARDQAARLDAKATALRARVEAETAARLRVREDVRALESYLTRLGERKRLLRDMAESRAEFPDEFEPTDLSGAGTIRANLAALSASLVETEMLARARAEAELEVSALERS